MTFVRDDMGAVSDSVAVAYGGSVSVAGCVNSTRDPIVFQVKTATGPGVSLLLTHDEAMLLGRLLAAAAIPGPR